MNEQTNELNKTACQKTSRMGMKLAHKSRKSQAMWSLSWNWRASSVKFLRRVLVRGHSTIQYAAEQSQHCDDGNDQSTTSRIINHLGAATWPTLTAAGGRYSAPGMQGKGRDVR